EYPHRPNIKLTAGRPLRKLTSASGVVVKALARLATELTGGDHATQDGHSGVVGVAELVVERVENRQRRIETDEVQQGERSHREAAATLRGGVDVVSVGGPVLQHPHRVVQVREQ